ncbi:hypothetical protein ACIBAG_37895 [Streptomyces sp. NPDC051243]|uniref:hypothetical protein n=1 Tax=Streptomyces sp. NPDC051243 TaxID=3365646 RepID=UPI00378D00D7
MPFEADRLLVAFRQDFGDDEDAAEVFDDLAFGEFVQDFVGEGRRPEPTIRPLVC